MSQTAMIIETKSRQKEYARMKITEILKVRV